MRAKQLWRRFEAMIKNPDIAFGFFLGSSVTSLLLIAMEYYYDFT